MFLSPSDTSTKGQMSYKPPGKNSSEGWRYKFGQYFKIDGNHEIIRKDGKVTPYSEYSKGTWMCKSIQIGDYMTARRIKGMREA